MPALDFPRAVADWLVDHGTGFVLNGNLFVGRRAKLPVKGSAAQAAGYLVIVGTGGPDSLRSQRAGIARPTAQLAAAAETPAAARAIMSEAYDTLGGVNGLTNFLLASGQYCQRLVARGVPQDVSADDIDNAVLTLNVDAMLHGSSSAVEQPSWIQLDWIS